jgi:hypothetical protein
MNTISINWIIKQLLVKKTEGSLSNVVILANWSCRASDGTYSAVLTGCTDFAPPSENFTPYEDLTQEQVLNWCFASGVDKTAIEANVTAQIADQINPPVIAPPLPWVEPAPEVEKVLVTQADSEPSSAQEIVAPVQDVTDAPAA